MPLSTHGTTDKEMPSTSGTWLVPEIISHKR